ncbi:hypothetical protein BCR36DRAFT_256719, partial [Piromyces finnis]
DENDSPTSLKIANYFFEVGLTDESLIKQFTKQLNEESMNNRRKLKRLLSNANPEGLIENKEFLQNYKRKENIGSITESLNSLSANNGSSVNSLSLSLYHSDESLENHKVNSKEFINKDLYKPSELTEEKKLNTVNTCSINCEDNIFEKELPPIPQNNKLQDNINIDGNINEIKNEDIPHITKSRSVSRSSFSINSLTKKISSTNTLDSLNLCIDDKEDEKISPETLETNQFPVNEPKAKEISFNNSFSEKGNKKLKSVSSMPLISNSLKKSLSKSVLVHEFDDDAPLAYVSI